MEYITGTKEFKLHNTCVTLGKFDGMHRGHQLLFRELLRGKEKGLASVMFTFDYHPCNLFSDKEISLIYTEDEKRYLLEQKGPDILVSFPFTEETAAMEPEDFIEKVLIWKLDAKVIVVGEDFRFGKNRRGTVAILSAYADKYGYEVKAMKKLELDGKIISSSLIREKLSLGKIEYVNELMGYPYSIIGEVVHGRKIGRTLGLPTINILPSQQKLLPPNGVYFSKVNLGTRVYNGVTNIGYKPTVGAELKRGVETYLFCFNEYIYGKKVNVQLYTFERSELKFNSLDELNSQIQKDIMLGQEYFEMEMNSNVNHSS